jgi:hypothetical protein
VGVDGATDSSLIQTGTTQETSEDTTAYFAWYEILPSAATEIFSVSPGDQMEASVQEVTAGTWTIAITDSTSGQTFSNQFAYSGPQSSAEWIEEAPTVNNEQSALADFGTAQFTDINYSASNPGSVTPTPIDMVDTNHDVIASPGALSNNSFTVTDDEAGTPPTPAATSTRVSVNPTSSTSGNTVTYTATVTSSGGTPTGTVTFATGSTALCTTGDLVTGTGSCSATSAPVGNDTITGTFGGNASFSTSSGTTTLEVAPVAPPPATHGYWLVGSDGGIFTFGSAQFHGSTGNLRLQRPVVGITLTGDRGGYWLVASDGGVFTFGDAGFVGSIPGIGIAPAGSGAGRELNAPIVGMVPTSNGGGYFLVASDGGVFAFGDARFEGSCPGIGGCSGAAVTVMPDASGNGYWLVTATGHVYTFGDAMSYGSPGPQSVPVTSAVRTPTGQGYWILFANGNVDAFGNAANLGAPVNETGGLNPGTAIFATSDGGGYWVSSANGTVFSFGDAPNDGGMAGTRLNGSIIAGAGF